jgi:hypothetical protein
LAPTARTTAIATASRSELVAEATTWAALAGSSATVAFLMVLIAAALVSEARLAAGAANVENPAIKAATNASFFIFIIS